MSADPLGAQAGAAPVSRIPHPAGYFGKVPTHGDFVTDRLERTFRDPLDAWLRASISASQRAMGAAWLPAFLVAPVWRFAFAAGACSPSAAIGVLMSSVDRVGRYYPLVVAAVLPGDHRPPDALATDEAFFTRADALARSTLSDDFHIGAFGQAGRDLIGWAMIGGEPAPPGDTLWWTAGSEGFPATAFRTASLPRVEDFKALLTGDLRGTALDAATPPAVQTPILAVPASPSPRRSVALKGAVHSQKSARARIGVDATFMAPDNDLFALASGAPENRDGLRAAHAATDALREVHEPFSLNDLVADVKGRMGKAHAILRARALNDGGDVRTGIAVLAAKGDRYAVLWAGAVRVYAVNAGTLRQLTSDHVEVGVARRVIRSIGGPGPPRLETATGVLSPGDRFVLASPQIGKALTPVELADAVAGDPLPDVARRLVQDALIVGANGTVTALLVDVGEVD